MLLTITKYPNRKTVIGNEVSLELGDLANLFKNPTVTSETTAQFMAMSKDEQSELKDRGGYIAGQCQGTRGKGCVINRTAITLDLDDGDILTADNIKSRCQYKYWLHSTRKHTKENPRYRLIVPLAEPVEAKDYELLARTLAQDIGVIDNADTTTYQAERMMYFPTISTDGMENYVFVEDGDQLLNPISLLSRYPHKEDMACWPRASQEVAKVRKEITDSQIQNPLDKPGLIGAFNRAYPIREAIDKFLSNVYAPVPNNYDRYSYTNADSTGGLVIYDNTAYSHHESDPAHGRLLNAFDLVRIHLFGEDDYGIDTITTPINELPSQQQMLELARTDEKVIADILDVPEGMEPDYELLESRVETDTATQSNSDWEKDLSRNKNGELDNSLTNFAQILRHDPRLQGIAVNKMSGNIIVNKKLPWREVLGNWSNADFSQLNVFLDNAYHINNDKRSKDALVAVANEHAFHPLHMYFDKYVPEWDNTPRVDTLLIDYLGAEDSDYTRTVTRKTLTAAVARAFKPGIKFDTVLTLVGPQGIGKSTIFSKLAGQLFTDTLTLHDMRDKTSAEKIVNYWIVELSELAGKKDVEIELVKAFITRCDDAYRPAYGVVTDSHPRQCILVATTNREEGFLYDTTGNRRFWPVKVTGECEKHPWDLTDEIICQIWAEAKHYYDSNEKLYLEGELAEQATVVQQDMMVKDERAGVVEDWLMTRAIDTVCCIELWVSLFNNDKSTYDRKAQVQMGKIMKSLPDWEQEGFQNTESFGKQRIYRYHGTQPLHTAILKDPRLEQK